MVGRPIGSRCVSLRARQQDMQIDDAQHERRHSAKRIDERQRRAARQRGEDGGGSQCP